MVSISKASRCLPRDSAVFRSWRYSDFVSSRSLLRKSLRWMRRYFTRHSCQPIKAKNLFRAESLAFTVSGQQPWHSRYSFHSGAASFKSVRSPSQSWNSRKSRWYFSILPRAYSKRWSCCKNWKIWTPSNTYFLISNTPAYQSLLPKWRLYMSLPVCWRDVHLFDK